MVNLTEINFDKLKKFSYERFTRQRDIGSKTNLKRLSAILLAAATIGTFTGCDEYVYKTMDITGEIGILDEITDETCLDEAYKLKKYKSLYKDMEKLEVDLKTYDQLDISKVNESLKIVPYVVANPYNNKSFEDNLDRFNELKKIRENRKLTVDEAKELHSVCHTLIKQKEEFETNLPGETWKTVYANTMLVIKTIFINSHEIDYKENLASDKKIEILTREDTDDETILYKKSDIETKNFYIKGGTALDELFDKVIELNADRNKITIDDIKDIISRTKDVLLEQYCIREETNDIYKMDDNDSWHDTNCKRYILKNKTVSESSDNG